MVREHQLTLTGASFVAWTLPSRSAKTHQQLLRKTGQMRTRARTSFDQWGSSTTPHPAMFKGFLLLLLLQLQAGQASNSASNPLNPSTVQIPSTDLFNNINQENVFRGPGFPPNGAAIIGMMGGHGGPRMESKIGSRESGDSKLHCRSLTVIMRFYDIDADIRRHFIEIHIYIYIWNICCVIAKILCVLAVPVGYRL